MRLKNKQGVYWMETSTVLHASQYIHAWYTVIAMFLSLTMFWLTIILCFHWTWFITSCYSGPWNNSIWILKMLRNSHAVVCQWRILVGLSFSQNPLIRPTLDVETGDLVTRELLQGLGEIIAEDTNNILVQVITCTEMYITWVISLLMLLPRTHVQGIKSDWSCRCPSVSLSAQKVPVLHIQAILIVLNTFKL